jgi:hypothetical protein
MYKTKKYKTKKYKTKKYKTKKYKTKKYKTKKYKTKKYKNAKGINVIRCAKIMGECFRCIDNEEFLNDSNYIFNKQHKLKREKRFKIPKTSDAKTGRDIALQIMEQESQKF